MTITNKASTHYLYCDNHDVIQITHNSVFHEYIKYIEIDRHIIHQNILYCSSSHLYWHFRSVSRFPSSNFFPDSLEFEGNVTMSYNNTTWVDVVINLFWLNLYLIVWDYLCCYPSVPSVSYK